MKIEDALEKKLSHKTDAAFKESFMEKFEAEFGEQKTSIFDISWAKPAAMAFCLVLALVGVNQYQKSKNQNGQLSQLAQVSDMLEDLELLANAGDEFIEFNDEEWAILLGEQNPEDSIDPDNKRHSES